MSRLSLPDLNRLAGAAEDRELLPEVLEPHATKIYPYS